MFRHLLKVSFFSRINKRISISSIYTQVYIVFCSRAICGKLRLTFISIIFDFDSVNFILFRFLIFLSYISLFDFLTLTLCVLFSVIYLFQICFAAAMIYVGFSRRVGRIYVVSHVFSECALVCPHALVSCWFYLHRLICVLQPEVNCHLYTLLVFCKHPCWQHLRIFAFSYIIYQVLVNIVQHFVYVHNAHKINLNSSRSGV